MSTMNEFMKSLEGMTIDDLYKANKIIINKIRGRNIEESIHYEIGDNVSFLDRKGRKITAIVIRVNKKTLTLKESNGITWRVGYSYINPITESAPAQR